MAPRKRIHHNTWEKELLIIGFGSFHVEYHQIGTWIAIQIGYKLIYLYILLFLQRISRVHQSVAQIIQKQKGTTATIKCKKETRACGSSTHDDYFHRRTQVLFWPWQSGRSSSYSWWWTTATAAEISAGISQPLKTYVKLHKSETTETRLLNLCTRQKKNNTSCELRRDFRVRTRWTSAQHVTPNWRLCSSPDSSRTIWDTFQEQLPQHKEMLEALFEINKQQFKQVSDKSGQETRKTVKVVDISSNLLFYFVLRGILTFLD